MSQQDLVKNGTSSASMSVFNQSSGHRSANDKPSPFCLRLSFEERAYLESQAGSLPLGTYIRRELLGDQAKKRRVMRKPSLDDQKFSMLLSALGESHLSSNLNQLAKHANMGSLEVSAQIEQELHEAYETIIGIRSILLGALGNKG